mgnify:CR=1 FL=1|tara:strand:- start:4165 stop:4848 length:684 start_codon:yes stop_codon:yes gene_type:complete
MAFKMKAGKDGPMKKNFPGAFKLGPSTGLKGAQGREKNVKPMGAVEEKFRNYTDAGNSPMNLGSKTVKPGYVDIDGNPSERGRRNYTPESVGTVLGGTPNQMKSPKKAKAKKAATGEGVAVYNDQGQLHAKYNPGDVGYNQALMMLQNQSPNQMKSPKKMAKESPKKIVKTNTRKSTMKMKAKAGAKKDAMMDRKSAMTMKKSANKMNPGFDKLPKDVQAKIMKKKK